jgi:hypothetical protein
MLIQKARREQKRYPIVKIPPETAPKKRREKYMQGGIFAVSVTALCFDVLRADGISCTLVNEIIINRIEEIQDAKEAECWLATIIKTEKP